MTAVQGRFEGASLDRVLPINVDFLEPLVRWLRIGFGRTQTARPWRNPADIFFLGIRALLGTLDTVLSLLARF